MKITVQQDYAELRKANYPATGEQLDALFKLARAMREAGVDMPAEVVAWIEDCQSIKDLYPKPDASPK